MKDFKKKTVAFDFDGTLVKDCYPGIGAPNLEMFAIARKLKENGHNIILWTCRTCQKLAEAVHYCKEHHELEFHAVNSNVQEMIDKYGDDPRKVSADFYVDDRALVNTKQVLRVLESYNMTDKELIEEFANGRY